MNEVQTKSIAQRLQEATSVEAGEIAWGMIVDALEHQRAQKTADKLTISSFTKQTRPVDLVEGKLRIKCSTPMVQAWMREHMTNVVKRQLRGIVNRFEVEVEFLDRTEV